MPVSLSTWPQVKEPLRRTGGGDKEAVKERPAVKVTTWKKVNADKQLAPVPCNDAQPRPDCCYQIELLKYCSALCQCSSSPIRRFDARSRITSHCRRFDVRVEVVIEAEHDRQCRFMSDVTTQQMAVECLMKPDCCRILSEEEK